MYQLNPLHPTLVILKPRGLLARYIEDRLNIALRRTKTDLMTTHLLEAEINLSRIAFDGLRAVTARIPLIKKGYPVVFAVTLFAEECFPVEVICQFGHQHSPFVNFNAHQERLRTDDMIAYNAYVEQQMRHRVTFLPPVSRKSLRNRLNGFEEINSRIFYDIRFGVMCNFDLFGQLSKLTASNNK